MKEIHLNQGIIRNEIKEKLKNLQKFEQSEEFKNIKAYCDNKVSGFETKIEEELENRLYKTKKHEAIYSELDLMLFNRSFLEDITLQAKNKAFLEELKESLDAIKSHLYLQTSNFDFCIYSELDGIKHQYKLYMGFEHTVKQMITKYELQEKEVDVNSTINPYQPEVKSGQIANIDV